jgi:hypothetical protein
VIVVTADILKAGRRCQNPECMLPQALHRTAMQTTFVPVQPIASTLPPSKMLLTFRTVLVVLTVIEFSASTSAPDL